MTTLSQIRFNFLSELKTLNINVDVYSWKLKAKLRNHFADRIVFIERRGVSDLVCSSTVTVGDALRKASELQNLLQEDDKECFDKPETRHIDEKQLLHTAAGILQRQISDIAESKRHYDPSSILKSALINVPNLYQTCCMISLVGSQMVHHTAMSHDVVMITQPRMMLPPLQSAMISLASHKAFGHL